MGLKASTRSAMATPKGYKHLCRYKAIEGSQLGAPPAIFWRLEAIGDPEAGNAACGGKVYIAKSDNGPPAPAQGAGR